MWLKNRRVCIQNLFPIGSILVMSFTQSSNFFIAPFVCSAGPRFSNAAGAAAAGAPGTASAAPGAAAAAGGATTSVVVKRSFSFSVYLLMLF